MKKILLLLLTVVTVCSCYNDDDLWNKVNNLDERVTTLETTVTNMNANITTLQSLINALNQGKVITNMEQTSSGYTLTFSDGSTISITNGTNGINGTNGSDAPVIGVKADTDGVYYWTITTNDTTEWLTDSTGNKLRVTGTTPVMGVNSDGYWTVDTGNGATQISDADGNPIKATGEDGDSFFKSVTTDGSYVIITLTDGTSFTLVMGSIFNIANSDNFLFSSIENKTYTVTTENVDDATILSVTDGWTATIKEVEATRAVSQTEKELIITAPTVSSGSLEGEIKILVTSSNGYSKVVTMQVKAVHEARILTFEDADYKGTGNYLGNSDWSSLIDNPQYYGPLLYPESGELYNWSDDNNTNLASELPNGWGDNKYWGGGHAISNYVDMTISNGSYSTQLSVYYQDATTNYGGHNGSQNFCVHFGYKDDYNPATLPYIYFSDGIARTVDHMYVMCNTYIVNSMVNGDGFTQPLASDGYVKITAIGYDEDSNEAGQSEFYLAKDGQYIQEWTRWDLSGLGKVSMIEFNISGDSSNYNSYGLGRPAYFCYDDVAVVFEE